MLDVGCAEGYYVFAAEWYGASAFGCDLDPDVVMLAREIASLKMSRAKFFQCEVMDLPGRPEVAGGFDVVLCLSLLHHLNHPLAALRILRSLTLDTLVVEAPSWSPGCGVSACESLREETRLGRGRRELPTRACWQDALESLFGSVSYMGAGKSPERHVFRAEALQKFDAEGAFRALQDLPKTTSDFGPALVDAEAVFGRASKTRPWNAFDEAHLVRHVRPAGLTPTQAELRAPTIEALVRDSTLRSRSRPTLYLVDDAPRTCLIADGHHRLAVAALAGETSVECNVMVRKAGKFKSNVFDVVGKGVVFDPEAWCAPRQTKAAVERQNP